MAGVTVFFEAPEALGPSGIFAGPDSNISEITDSNGIATAPFAANNFAGSYIVNAFVSGTTAPVSFALTNVSPLVSRRRQLCGEHLQPPVEPQRRSQCRRLGHHA